MKTAVLPRAKESMKAAVVPRAKEVKRPRRCPPACPDHRRGSVRCSARGRSRPFWPDSTPRVVDPAQCTLVVNGIFAVRKSWCKEAGRWTQRLILDRRARNACEHGVTSVACAAMPHGTMLTDLPLAPDDEVICGPRTCPASIMRSGSPHNEHSRTRSRCRWTSRRSHTSTPCGRCSNAHPAAQSALSPWTRSRWAT